MKSDKKTENKLKKYTIRFAAAFFIILAVLTYFSDTVDNLLVPKVKTTHLRFGTIDGSETMDERYQIPICSLVSGGGCDAVFCTFTDQESGETTVKEVEVTVMNSDDIYYEVSGAFDSSYRVIYSTSKSISDGDKVYIEEE